MARRGRNGKKAVRRRQAGIKLLNVAEAYVQANIVTQPLFGTSPIGFLFGDAGPTFAVSGGGFSLVEMVRNPEATLATAGARLMNPETVLTIGLKSAGANIAFRFGRRFLRRSISQINKNFMAPVFGKGAQGVAL
jgi:hypothetical protein